MISFFIFESHGRIVLLEEMEPRDAEAIFMRLGASAKDLRTKASRKAFFKKEAKKYHPDLHPGDKKKEVQFQNFSAANDLLQLMPDIVDPEPAAAPPGPIRPNMDGFTDFSKPEPEPEDAISTWQTDPNADSKIRTEDCTDSNFFKRSMWKRSGKSTEKFTIYAFNGTILSHAITVFGSEKIYTAMAAGMVLWNSYGPAKERTDAVLVRKLDPEWDGTIAVIAIGHTELDRFSKKPVFLHFEGDNPIRDKQFIQNLPATIKDIASGQ
jgi:hypothetical protein